MGLDLLYSGVFRKHAPPFPHPESEERLTIALEALKPLGELITLREPAPASTEDLLRVHDPQYLERVERVARDGLLLLDGDTYVLPESLDAVRAAAGASIEAASSAANSKPAFALVRPPGHHAGRSGRAMGARTQGFCIVNNVAVAAAWLLERGVKKVAIVDFDAHHGNGTQEIFYRDPRVLHIDLHEDPSTLYPGTGFLNQLGEGEARGTKVNVVLPPGSADDVYGLALEEVVLPILEEFKPELLLFSAGFDAFEGDGLTHLRAGEWAFARMGELPSELGLRGKCAAVLEGGYSVGLSRGLPAFIAALLDLRPEAEQVASREPVFRVAREYVRDLKGLLRQFWSL
ncbi:MAG: histone deacetylase family protein [Thermofilum sp.]